MPFGRTGRQNNRSQHALDAGGLGVDSAGGGSISAAGASGSGPSAASPNPVPFSSDSSFDSQHLQQHQQQQHHPLPVFVSSSSSPNSNTPPLLPANSASSGFDPRTSQQAAPPLDFADQVSRSQSQRYPQAATPLQAPQQFASASTSADDLSNTLHFVQGQPIPPPPPPPPPHQQQPQQPAPEARRSTRKLIKNILSGGSTSSRSAGGNDAYPQITPPNTYDNTAGLARRPSKRVSQPSTIRTGALSQVSLDLEWPPSQGQLTQPSPLQGVGSLNDPSYVIAESNQEPPVQDPHGLAHTSIRRVPTDHESSPYGPDAVGSSQPPQAFNSLQGQILPDQQQPQPQPQPQPQQQNPYGGQYDTSPQQYHFQNALQLHPQLQYQGGSQQVLGSHLNTSVQQNPETVSQFSHESPVTDTDPHSAQDSPAVNYPTQSPSSTQPQQQPQQQQQQQQQQMAPPGGQPPARRPQENEKNVRGQVEPPAGPPPPYRHGQATAMSPLPPAPPNAGGQNRQFEGGPAEGRNSPQPSTTDRDGNQDPEKALKDLGMEKPCSSGGTLKP